MSPQRTQETKFAYFNFIHRDILAPKKSFAKNNTNSDLSSGFVLFAYGGDKEDKMDKGKNGYGTQIRLRLIRFRFVNETNRFTQA